MFGTNAFEVMRNDGLVVLPDDLEAIDKRLFMVKEGELTARTLVPLKNDIPLGTETYAYDVITRKGAAEIYAAGATKIPLVDVDVVRKQRKIAWVVTGFQVTTPELIAARLANKPVETYKADACRRAIAERENTLAFTGDPSLEIEGLVNATGIQVIPAPNGAAGTAAWSTKTSMEILNDIRALAQAINNYKPHVADTLALPPIQHGLLQNPVSGNDTRTLMQYVLAAGWFKTIVSANELAKAGVAGVDCAIAMDSDPDVAELLVPGNGQDIFRDEPVRFDLGYRVPVYEQCGGTVIRYPLAIARMDGI